MDVGISLLVWMQVEPLVEIGAGLQVWVSRRATKVSDTLFISLGSVDRSIPKMKSKADVLHGIVMLQ